MLLKPLQDRVLVKLINVNPEKSPGGIFIPENVRNESPINVAQVVDVSEGYYNQKGYYIPIKDIHIGDIVMFPAMLGANIDNPMGFEEYMVVKHHDIMATVHPTEFNVPEGELKPEGVFFGGYPMSETGEEK